MLRPTLAVAVTWAALSGCRDLSGFTTTGDGFTGSVVQGDFVRTGVDAATLACLTIDADHLQDTPGALSTSDGRFHLAPLRPIPQIWHDSLSTLSFGEGRLKNLIYVVTATTSFADGNGDDVLAVVSLLQSGGIEVRLIRGAPAVPMDGGVDGGAPSTGANLFAIFDLARTAGPCSY